MVNIVWRPDLHFIKLARSISSLSGIISYICETVHVITCPFRMHCTIICCIKRDITLTYHRDTSDYPPTRYLKHMQDHDKGRGRNVKRKHAAPLEETRITSRRHHNVHGIGCSCACSHVACILCPSLAQWLELGDGLLFFFFSENSKSWKLFGWALIWVWVLPRHFTVVV